MLLYITISLISLITQQWIGACIWGLCSVLSIYNYKTLRNESSNDFTDHQP